MMIGKLVNVRPMEKADVPLLTRWWNDPRAFAPEEARWPTKASEFETRAARKPNYDKRGEFVVVLTTTAGTEQETIVGHCGYFRPSPVPALRCLEIGFATHPDHRRQGYATMAARLLVNQMFAATPVYRIQAHCRATNAGSQRVLAGVAMTHEATLRGYAYVGGAYEDAYLYSILRPEWSNAAAYAERFGEL